MRSPRRYPSRISKRGADSALTNLLYGSRIERFRTLTLRELQATSRLPGPEVERRWNEARRERGV